MSEQKIEELMIWEYIEKISESAVNSDDSVIDDIIKCCIFDKILMFCKNVVIDLSKNFKSA